MKASRTDDRRFFAAAAVACLAAGLSLGALNPAGKSPASEGDLLKELSAVKNAIVAGHKARDAAALARLYADDYTAIDADGKRRSKKELLASLPTDPEIVEGRYELIAARRWGDMAVANGRGHLVYRNPDGSTRTSDYGSVNVFVRRDGRWLYVAAFLP